MKIKWKNGSKEYWITEFVTTVTWSGADTQASRSLEFEMVNTPFDKSMNVPVLKGGDIVYFYDDNGSCRFEGRITGKNKISEVGTRQYTARDYMHNMVQSKASYVFKKKTAEYITKAICKDIGITIGSLVNTKKKIKKFIVQGESIYDIIDKAYKKAKTGSSYLMAMSGKSFNVVKRGGAIANFHLDSTKDIINIEFTENADSMVNQVAIYNQNNKKIGVVKNADWIKLYGIYQDVYEAEKKKKKASSADKAEAKKQLQGVDKKSTVEAIGNIACVSGRAVTILDTATSTSAEFWIKSDSHTWENGIHTMTLELSFKTAVKSTVSTGTSEKAGSKGTQKAKANSKYKAGSGKLGWPCNGKVIAKFSKNHQGIDIQVPSGTQIHAAAAGTVTKVAKKDKKLGKNVTIKHSNGLKTRYANCSSISVKKGKKVKKGDVIAKAGSTGSAKKSQCHFAVQKNGTWKDPAKYLK